MLTLFKFLYNIIRVVAYIVAAAGGIFTLLGVYDFIHAFSYFSLDVEGKSVVGLVGVGLLKAVDLFLVAIVFFVFSIGLLVLFSSKADEALPAEIPGWLRIRNFMQLKIILWEAILTSLVVSYLAKLASMNFKGLPFTYSELIIPAAILFIALSIYFLKKGEH